MSRLPDRSLSSFPRKRTASILSSRTTGPEGRVRASQVVDEKLLMDAGIYMDKHPQIMPTKESREICQQLLTVEHEPPKETIFADDVFETTCDRLRERNEAMVLRDLTPLLVPSVERWTSLTNPSQSWSQHIFREELNTPWSGLQLLNSMSTPQPDVAVAFARTAFSASQLRRLERKTSSRVRSRFMATEWLFFPFLTCKVNSGEEGLHDADCHNAHSNGVAITAVVDLYRLVSREMELHRQVLSFSVSHDNETVRIYAHYPEIDGESTSIYRHSLRKYDFTDQGGKERWTCYIFIMNLYNDFAPLHLKRLTSAIDQLPDPETEEGPSDSCLDGDTTCAGSQDSYLT